MSAKELRTMMGWYHDGTGWGGWVLMTIFMVGFWGLVVFAVIALFRGTRSGGEWAPEHRDPIQILDERFARGEIDEDEYHARSAVLRGSGRYSHRPDRGTH
ncbi:SHOCT domain-containing protein [Nocardioides sp.]|uniref:SHOCT domain-containing protein n=1 Tax=Nocardioides sp. TaxID=35761 RepID=UPI00262687AE|nr:SHOCT domain-containing protein [Nocardioides sp.]MDI6910511.1 SHOCT domain-containing protein [Nocardioides sp.]